MRKHFENPVPEPKPTLTSARVPASVRIGKVELRPATVLAPMAGVTDTVFRRFIRSVSFIDETQAMENYDPRELRPVTAADPNACGLIMTEFTSADGVTKTKKKSVLKRYLGYLDDEHPLAAQLFGSNPNVLAEAAKLVEDMGFDTVDLNLGCPAKKVVKCNGGSGLLRDIPKIEKAFRRFPEVVKVVTRTGSPEVATDVMGIEDSDVFVILKPQSEWTTAKTKEDLIEGIEEPAGAATALAAAEGAMTLFI